MPKTEPSDQPRHTPLQVASVKATHATMNTYVFAETVNVQFRNQHLSFRDGVAIPLEPVMVAFLNANGIFPTQQ